MARALTARNPASRGMRTLCRPGPKTLTAAQIAALSDIRDLAPCAGLVLEELLLYSRDERVRLAACQEVLDRTFGRVASQAHVQVQHMGGPAAPQTDEDKEQMLVAALAAVRARKAEQALVVDAEEAESDQP